MKLQLALDLVNIPEAIELIKEVEAFIDVVEIGTPVVINEGLRAVKEVKQAFPNLRVLADLKIMDAVGFMKCDRHLKLERISSPFLRRQKICPFKER